MDIQPKSTTLPRSLFSDSVISSVKRISFFSESVRAKMKTYAGLDEDIRGLKVNKPVINDPLRINSAFAHIAPPGATSTAAKDLTVAFGGLTADQIKIVSQKSDEHKYMTYVLLGPYEERISNRLRVVYKGIYRRGQKDIWGKMRFEDGTYIESQFKNGELFGKILVVKPNGVYFEGNIAENETFRGYFRNPLLKRQSRLDKDKDSSKHVCYGVNEEGYIFLKNGQRYRGMLSDSKQSL